MIVDEPSSYVYYGSMVAAPYVSQVYKKIFDYLGMQPKPTKEVKQVEMPELTGVSLTDGVKAIKNLGLQYELAGEGQRVISTVPSAGNMVPEGDIVLLRVG
jgi:stage V sporulation protein D (sporulation-specific penicillin-binding protein)